MCWIDQSIDWLIGLFVFKLITPPPPVLILFFVGKFFVFKKKFSFSDQWNGTAAQEVEILKKNLEERMLELEEREAAYEARANYISRK